MNWLTALSAFAGAFSAHFAASWLTKVGVPSTDWRGYLAVAKEKALPVLNGGATIVGYAVLFMVLAHGTRGCNLSPLPPIPWPLPPSPTPVDPFQTTLQSAYGADGSATKNQDRLALAGVYHRGVETAKRQDLATVGALLTAMRTDANKAIDDRLMMVRQVIATELDKTLPRVPSTPLDDPTREKIAGQFDRMARLLEALK